MSKFEDFPFPVTPAYMQELDDDADKSAPSASLEDTPPSLHMTVSEAAAALNGAAQAAPFPRRRVERPATSPKTSIISPLHPDIYETQTMGRELRDPSEVPGDFRALDEITAGQDMLSTNDERDVIYDDEER